MAQKFNTSNNKRNRKIFQGRHQSTWQPKRQLSNFIQSLHEQDPGLQRIRRRTILRTDRTCRATEPGERRARPEQEDVSLRTSQGWINPPAL